MSADNVVLLFTLVWTFTAVCQADDDFSVSCEGVSGSVGKEVTLTCSVSLQYTECCITVYKFQYTESDDDSICKEEPPVNSCEQRNSFICRYSPTTAMTEQFTFFLQTECGEKTTEFTVNMTDPIKPEIDNEAPDFCSITCDDVTGSVGEDVTFTCSVPQQCTECCIKMFKYYEIYKDSAICIKELPYSSCEQRNSFTCRYTSSTVMTEKFRFLLQTSCGRKRTEFSVDIRETMQHGTDTEVPGKRGPGTVAIVISGVSSFIIIIITFITVMVITCVKRFKSTNPSGLQKKYEGVSEEQTMMTTNV